MRHPLAARPRFWDWNEALVSAVNLGRSTGHKHRVTAVYADWWPWPVWAVEPADSGVRS